MMGFLVQVILLSSICPLVFFSALFLTSFISLGLYFLLFFSTVCISCSILVFSLFYKQRPATPNASSVTTKTHIIPPSLRTSSPPSGKFSYDVFLSFRGKDVRENFIDHLYTALIQKGIHTFRDDEELQRGESIGPNLLKAIEESRYVIAVFSLNYADSAWCLDEIAKVADCMNKIGQKVLPVFYHVDPSDVRRQTGEHFRKAFEKHQKRYKGDPYKVKRWKDALSQIGNLSGWHLHHGSEAKIIQEIVEKVFTELNKIISTSGALGPLVGMVYHRDELLSYLDIGCRNEVRIIGICGMGGIGKTTIAQVVFATLKAQFEGHSFLENVKQETEKQGSSIHLQEKLLFNLLHSKVNIQNTEMGKDIIKHRLSTKRVLIVLDDVDQDIQLETLCHRTWFGPGSRIIITSRDEHMISAFGAQKIYQVNPLTDHDALKLFCLRAFKDEDEVGEDFLKLSNEFLKYADGLPLAIKVLGSSVRGRNAKLWSSALKRLEKNPPKEITDVLKVSFDGLEETEKKTFLDIACFFKGENKDRVIRVLDGCDDDGVEMDVQVLMDKALVTLFGSNLWMHDLIQEMGQEVVIQECREEPGKRSRLWLPKEIIGMLCRSKATSAVQSISLLCPTKDDVVHSNINDSFSNMDGLRLLKIWNVKFSGNIKYLSNELQYLKWHECPLDSFPSDFQPEKLVELHMPFSRIKHLWRGKKGWSTLRLIDLSGSKYLMSTPDFTEVPDLEELVLKICTNLVEVHPSLGFIKKLRTLDLHFCKSIESLPPFITMDSLQILRLSGCSGLKNFPDIEGNMRSLLELHLDQTSIEELPPSIERMISLTMLNLQDCKNLLHLPNTIGCLTSLQSLSLMGCSKIDEVPENLSGMKCLEKLYIGGTSIKELTFADGMKHLQHLSCRGCKCLDPDSFKGLATLSSLIELDLGYCNLMDGEFLNYFSALISLRLLELCGNCFVRLPESISQLSKLESLGLSNCSQLQLLPKNLPPNLKYVSAENCTSLTDYPNQIKVLSSSKSGVTTTVNSLNSLRNSQISSKVIFARNEEESAYVCVTYKDTEREQVDFLPLKTLACLQRHNDWSNFCRIYPSDEIPEWFSTTSIKHPISMSIPQLLADDKKWKGFAACAIFAFKGHTALSLIEPCPDNISYSYRITLDTDIKHLEPIVSEYDDLGYHVISSHLRVIFYIKGFEFQQRIKSLLNQSTVVRAIFETNNPSMIVQKCGIRLIYEQDAECFARATYGDDPICLSTEFDTSSASFRSEKFIPPLDESTLVLKKNLESVLPRYLEAVNTCGMFKFDIRGIPEWFHKSFQYGTGTNLAVMSIDELPQNLHMSKKWMGFAICLSLVEEVGQTMNDDYGVSVSLEPGDLLVSVVAFERKKLVPVVHLRLDHVKPLSEKQHRLLVFFISRERILKVLHAAAQTLTTTMNFYIICGSPHVKVQTGGFRLVDQPDIQAVADTLIQCMQEDNTLKSYNELVVEEWIKLIRFKGAHIERMTEVAERDSRTPREKHFDLQSQKYRDWDWSDPRPVSCDFKRADISKWNWFVPSINPGNSAECQLPLNVFDDDNFLGFAVCFQLSPDQYPADYSENGFLLNYRLDSDVAWRGLFDFGMISDIKINKSGEYVATQFHFIPRKRLSKMWRKCKLARITVWCSSPCLSVVHSCALRLFFKEDIAHVVETLILAELS